MIIMLMEEDIRKKKMNIHEFVSYVHYVQGRDGNTLIHIITYRSATRRGFCFFSSHRRVQRILDRGGVW